LFAGRGSAAALIGQTVKFKATTKRTDREKKLPPEPPNGCTPAVNEENAFTGDMDLALFNIASKGMIE
jgi:hypothetical protein